MVVSNTRRRAGRSSGPRAAGVETAVFEAADYPDRAERDRAMAGLAEGERGPSWSCWPATCSCSTPRSWPSSRSAVINVHPALLPAFPGAQPDRGPDRLWSQDQRCDGPFRGRRGRHRTDHLAGGSDASLHSRPRGDPDGPAPHGTRAPATRDPACSRAGGVRIDADNPRYVHVDEGVAGRAMGEHEPKRRSPDRRPACRATCAIERALLTVSDKRGVVDFARALTELGVEIISTGGTASELGRRRHRRRARSRTTPASRRSSTAA